MSCVVVGALLWWYRFGGSDTRLPEKRVICRVKDSASWYNRTSRTPHIFQ